MDDRYAIRSFADRYDGLWVVLRERDGKRMCMGNVLACLGWVKTWGDVDLGR